MKPRRIVFGETVEKYMRKNNLTMKELGEKVGKGESTVSLWISGKSTPTMGTVQKLADYFGISTDELIFGYDPSIMDVGIPLYSDVSCGLGLFVDDQIEDYITVPSKYLTPNKEYFAMTAKGDSMIDKGIVDGDVLVFEKDSTLSNGQIGCFCIDENEAVCKVFRRTNEGLILLMSANENYDPIVVDVTKTCFKILGKLRVKFSKVE